jgi:hypothetical protein
MGRKTPVGNNPKRILYMPGLIIQVGIKKMVLMEILFKVGPQDGAYHCPSCFGNMEEKKIFNV